MFSGQGLSLQITTEDENRKVKLLYTTYIKGTFCHTTFVQILNECVKRNKSKAFFSLYTYYNHYNY